MPAALGARVVTVLVLSLTLVQGCFVDTVPSRDPLDQIWNEWMLAGRYGEWIDGKEYPLRDKVDDKISSSPSGASYTKYAIEVDGPRGYFQGDWHLIGGLMGRVDIPSAFVELFGKEIVRRHWPKMTVKWGRDYSYEFFLVLRTHEAGRGQLIKRWFFPPELLALIINPKNEESFRRNYPEKEAQQLIEQNKYHSVNGFLRFEAATRTAIVTITGLTRPFEERIDLSKDLPSRQPQRLR